MKKTVISALFLLIPIGIVCLIFIHLFSVSVATLSVLAAILSCYGTLMTLSWKNSKKAEQLQLYPDSHTGGKTDIIKVAFCISTPFYFLLFLLSLFPIQHYSVWFLFFLPAMIVLALPLEVAADFCKMFGIPKKQF